MSATISFDHFRNQLGDPLEAVNVRIMTNIPATVRIQIHLDEPSNLFAFHDGDRYNKCIPDGCLVSKGKAFADWWCSNNCPEGLYTVTLDVCSYAENNEGLGGIGIRCNHQEADYLKWVGKLGANLVGNPIAVPDSDHAVILNLRRELSFGRTAQGQVATPDQVAAAQKHIAALKSVDHDLATRANAVANACNGAPFSAACQQALQGASGAVDQAESSVNSASLPCSAAADADYVQALSAVKSTYTQLLAASRGGSASAFNAGVDELQALSVSLSSTYSAALNAACP